MDRVDSIQDVKVWGDGIEFTNNWLVMDWVEKRKRSGGSPGGDNHAFTSWREGNTFWIYWWHPKTIGGSRTFKVKYSVIGGIGISEHYDQLYWKAIFKDHNVPVMMSKVTVNFPYEIAPKSLVLESYGIGADSRLVDHKTIEFSTGRIPPREELEILVRFPHKVLDLPLPASRQFSHKQNISKVTTKSQGTAQSNWKGLLFFTLFLSFVLYKVLIKGRKCQTCGKFVWPFYTSGGNIRVREVCPYCDSISWPIISSSGGGPAGGGGGGGGGGRW